MKTTVQLYKQTRKHFDNAVNTHLMLTQVSLPQLIFAKQQLKQKLHQAYILSDEEKIKFNKYALSELDKHVAETLSHIKEIKAQKKFAQTLLSKIGQTEKEINVNNSITLFKDIVGHQLTNKSITTFDLSGWLKNKFNVNVEII
jgi:hypothetical protein